MEMLILCLYFLIVFVVAIILKVKGNHFAAFPLAMVWPITLIAFGLLLFEEKIIDRLVDKIKG